MAWRSARGICREESNPGPLHRATTLSTSGEASPRDDRHLRSCPEATCKDVEPPSYLVMKRDGEDHSRGEEHSRALAQNVRDLLSGDLGVGARKWGEIAPVPADRPTGSSNGNLGLDGSGAEEPPSGDLSAATGRCCGASSWATSQLARCAASASAIASGGFGRKVPTSN